MRKPVKQAILYASRALGLFALVRRMTRRGLRILCFHGGSIHDEHLFRPGLFMRAEKFRQRFEDLARWKYPVLDLTSALQALAENRLPPCATVITIDDGFYSTFCQVSELLQKFRFPATVYVTTYYALKQTPIFRLAVCYLFWKTQVATLEGVGLPLERPGLHDLTDPVQKDRLCWEIIEYAESRLDEGQRDQLARELAKRLGIDYETIVASRAFHIMADHEIRTLADSGIDIQLHTHRHHLPTDPELAAREVIENRDSLAGIVKRPLEHLCYPSGIWSEEHWSCLGNLGITSAVTCDPGLNYADTPRFALRRFSDADDLSPIEFESELSGFSEFLRRIRSRLVRTWSSVRPTSSSVGRRED